MDIKRFFRRLRAVISRKKKAKEGDAQKSVGAAATTEPVIVHHPQIQSTQPAEGDIKPASTAELRAAADPQSLSPFLGGLPLEIRRKIYHEVWAGYLKPRRVAPEQPGSDLRLHIYTPSSASTTMTHTRCVLHPGETVRPDSFVTRPWPFDTHGVDPSFPPPRWFFEAWVIRLNWGKHWKCQHAVQKQWDSSKPVMCGLAQLVMGERAPFLPLFLACKKMYLEAAQSFFETVTLVFTSSLDAHRFFTQQPHRFLPHLRHLELSFTHPNDHLYLTRIQHDEPYLPRTPGSDPNHPVGPTSASAAVVLHDNHQDFENIGLTVPLPHGDEHVCFNMWCRVNVFGGDLWRTLLLQGVRGAAPGLRDLSVNLGGRMKRNVILDPFGTIEEDDSEEGEASSIVGSVQAALQPEFWVLPGNLAVMFAFGDQKKAYKQVGTKMVKMEWVG